MSTLLNNLLTRDEFEAVYVLVCNKQNESRITLFTVETFFQKRCLFPLVLSTFFASSNIKRAPAIQTFLQTLVNSASVILYSVLNSVSMNFMFQKRKIVKEIKCNAAKKKQLFVFSYTSQCSDCDVMAGATEICGSRYWYQSKGQLSLCRNLAFVSRLCTLHCFSIRICSDEARISTNYFLQPKFTKLFLYKAAQTCTATKHSQTDRLFKTQVPFHDERRVTYALTQYNNRYISYSSTVTP